ncbi:phage-related baseplate assembly protein [Neoasaia chiangmaiensis NBRC 101099]|uniref:Baseplate assembly protein n=1 Tax=Neoasaia chiangmaiensis TaxID=320497 RepID=A0A1U9KQ04_9PROT|nr:baseplate assembly protein [Neoasaia chiangmaiensis]AQS87904.1 baseplate assembly protein [Neoasaia chiangmaiensis]GBR39135.1 phage-related baseplate assembly protein [Neoasaia chiangmaiensis NBRC 101099]GEN15552.1 hypothetical protein NCH01_19830 [Neoasaia chiangmaiensis]
MSERYVSAAVVNRVAHVVHGIVSAVDPANHAVKVRLQPEDVETGWIADAAMAQVGDLRVACPSAVGTHVVLQPIEGDGEHWVVSGVVYDTVMTPVVSPATGLVAQPGELLVMAGCGTPPGEAEGVAGAATTGGGWWHVTRQGVFCGAGDAVQVVRDGSVSWSVGGVRAVLSASGLTVSGGDVRTDAHSLDGHVHPVGDEMTGRPVG